MVGPGGERRMVLNLGEEGRGDVILVVE
jgi:hypothetical protein